MFESWFPVAETRVDGESRFTLIGAYGTISYVSQGMTDLKNKNN